MLMIMNPNQPYAPPPPAPNPYDFITNPAPDPKTPKLGNSFKSRLLIVAGAGVLLIMIASILGAVLSRSGKGDISGLKDIAAHQTELIRVAELGADKAQSTPIRSLAYTTKLSVTTQHQKLVAYLGTRGVELTEVELAAHHDDSVDEELETAAGNNRFDEAFNEVLNQELTDYNNSMKTAYQSATSEKSKALLAESYASSGTLLGLK